MGLSLQQVEQAPTDESFLDACSVGVDRDEVMARLLDRVEFGRERLVEKLDALARRYDRPSPPLASSLHPMTVGPTPRPYHPGRH